MWLCVVVVWFVVVLSGSFDVVGCLWFVYGCFCCCGVSMFVLLVVSLVLGCVCVVVVCVTLVVVKTCWLCSCALGCC